MGWKYEEMRLNAHLNYLYFSDIFEKLLNELEIRCGSRLKCMQFSGLGVIGKKKRTL